MKAFKKLNRNYEKIFLIYPSVLFKYLTFLNEYSDKKILENTILLQNDFLVKNQNEIKRRRNLDLNTVQEICKLKEVLSLNSIFSVRVNHIYESYGLFIELKEKSKQDSKNFSILYSGDTRPTQNLLDIGKNCDLLIHECTFDNEYFKEAIEKKHSTISEAIEVGKHMNAKWTLLTHFSTRYGRISVVDDVSKNNVGFSFDFMQLTAKSLERVNDIVPQLKVVFKEYADIYLKNKIKKSHKQNKD
jgi:ribonuclease Z